MPVITEKNCTSSFLDAGQYQRNGILRYERVFGHSFVSTGGLETTKAFASLLNLKPGMKVLDIGSGTGGSAFFLAREYGVEVLGLDLSHNMLAIANEHKQEMEPEVQNRVTFRYLDALKASFPPGTFDVMYSRDAIMHIADKDALYGKVFEWLKPGGQILVTEYVHGRNHPNHTEEYVNYVITRGYQFLPLLQYGDLLKRVGFEQVKAIDKTDEFVSVLKEEMQRFRPTKASFVKEFSLNDYNELVNGWDVKVDRCTQGEQGWGLFLATKPCVQ